jgi:hypothetical protein
MKLSILVLSLGSASSFCIRPTTTSLQSALRYTIIGNPDEEVEEASPAAVAQPTASTDSRFGPSSLEGYSDYNERAEFETELGVDSFSNKAGGGIMPGFDLSSLCSDD